MLYSYCVLVMTVVLLPEFISGRGNLLAGVCPDWCRGGWLPEAAGWVWSSRPGCPGGRCRDGCSVAAGCFAVAVRGGAPGPGCRDACCREDRLQGAAEPEPSHSSRSSNKAHSRLQTSPILRQLRRLSTSPCNLSLIWPKGRIVRECPMSFS